MWFRLTVELRGTINLPEQKVRLGVVGIVSDRSLGGDDRPTDVSFSAKKTHGQFVLPHRSSPLFLACTTTVRECEEQRRHPPDPHRTTDKGGPSTHPLARSRPYFLGPARTPDV